MNNSNSRQTKKRKVRKHLQFISDNAFRNNTEDQGIFEDQEQLFELFSHKRKKVKQMNFDDNEEMDEQYQNQQSNKITKSKNKRKSASIFHNQINLLMESDTIQPEENLLDLAINIHKQASREKLEPQKGQEEGQQCKHQFNCQKANNYSIKTKIEEDDALYKYDLSEGHKTKTKTKKSVNQCFVEIPQWAKAEHVRDANMLRPSEHGYDPSTLYIPPGELSKFTPYAQQYWELKARHFDSILFLKRGRFFDCLYNDAITVHRIMDYHFQMNQFRIGIPNHQFERSLHVLTDEGLKVAIAQQLESENQFQKRILLSKQAKSSAKQKKFQPQGQQNDSVNTKQLPTEIEEENKQQQLQAGFGSEDDYDNNINDNDYELDQVMKREVTAVYSKSTFRYFHLRQDVDPIYLASVYCNSKVEGVQQFGVAILDTLTNRIIVAAFVDDLINSQLKNLMFTYRSSEILFCEDQLTRSANKMLKTLPHKPFFSNITQDKNNKNHWQSETSLNILKVQAGKNSVADKTGESSILMQESWLPYGLRLMSQENAEAPAAFSALSGLFSYLQKNLLLEQILVSAKFVYFNNQMMIEQDDDFSYNKSENKRLIIESNTLQNLEILQLQNTSYQAGKMMNQMTLYQFLNQTSTKFGSRLLRQWILSPLCLNKQILDRQNALIDFENMQYGREKFKSDLKEIEDLESILANLYSYSIKYNGADFLYENICEKRLKEFKLFLAQSTFIFQSLQHNLATNVKYLKSERLKKLLMMINQQDGGLLYDINQTVKKFENYIIWVGKNNDIPIPVPGLNKQYDDQDKELKKVNLELENYLQEQRDRFQIDGADQMINYSHAKFPYQLEVPVKILEIHKKPVEYMITTKREGFDRFYTNDLKKLIRKRDCVMETLRTYLCDFTAEIFRQFLDCRFIWDSFVKIIAEIDCLIALHQVSFGNQFENQLGKFVRPIIVDNSAENSCSHFFRIFDFKNPQICLTGVHFVGVETYLNCKKFYGSKCYNRCSIITGANMGGKSTVLRSVAVAVIMAQIGCFVPCQLMEFTPFDRLFTRIGARDYILEGKSTFYTEMEETLSICNNCSINSLILIDELGRGTGAHDGIAVAYAVLRHLIERTKSLIMFTTHSKHLINEFYQSEQVSLYKMGQAFINNKIIFNYKLEEGVCENSQALNILKALNFQLGLILNAEFHTILNALSNNSEFLVARVVVPD